MGRWKGLPAKAGVKFLAYVGPERGKEVLDGSTFGLVRPQCVSEFLHHAPRVAPSAMLGRTKYIGDAVRYSVLSTASLGDNRPFANRLAAAENAARPFWLSGVDEDPMGDAEVGGEGLLC